MNSNNQLATVPIPEGSGEPKWGTPRATRGMEYDLIAREFGKQFPPGSHPTDDDFGHFFEQRGKLAVPINAPKDSAIWKAYTMDRWAVRRRLNAAASHIRMRDGAEPFVVRRDTTKPNTLIVKTLEEDIESTTLAGIKSYSKYKQKQLAWDFQGIDWTQQPPYRSEMLTDLYDDADDLTKNFTRMTEQFDAKVKKLAERIGKLDKQALGASQDKLLTDPAMDPDEDIITDSDSDVSDDGSDESPTE